MGAIAAIVGPALVITALAPGRTARHAVATERSAAVVVDNEVIASALARHAARAGSIDPDNVSVSVSQREAVVRVTPVSGPPLDREVIFVIGLVVLALGAAAIALESIQRMATAWTDVAPRVRTNLSRWFASAPLPGTTVDWWWIGVLAVLLAIMDSAVAEQLVQDALTVHPELVSSHVSIYLVRRSPVRKVSAIARRGVSPRDVVDTVEPRSTRSNSCSGIRCSPQCRWAADSVPVSVRRRACSNSCPQ